jgi:hypothetical protein
MRPTSIGLLALTFACGPLPLRAVEEAIAPVAIAVHADATYAVDGESGAVVRVRGDARDTIATIDGAIQKSLSVGRDESVWYADPHGTFHAWNGRAWREHDLGSVIEGARTVYNWRVAARTIDDAWAVAYDISDDAVRVHACHWDGRSWTCELAPIDEWPRAIAVSPSALWMVGMTDGSLRRKDAHGWTTIAGCVRDLEVIDDDHAFALGCNMELRAWNGSDFVDVLPDVKMFAARTNDDVWIVDNVGLLQHFDGTRATEVALLERTDDPRILPLEPGVTEIRVGGRWYLASR